ncbi:hypothetical protein HC891_04010 [Candidatus Gracilibacteria bacterium]|nr:hypothetical protein [Candidatus Gracilibacteria bacterium]
MNIKTSAVVCPDSVVKTLQSQVFNRNIAPPLQLHTAPAVLVAHDQRAIAVDGNPIGGDTYAVR